MELGPQSLRILKPVITAIIAFALFLLTVLLALLVAGYRINFRDQISLDRPEAPRVVLPGTIVSYVGLKTRQELERDGWLVCDGQELEINRFKALFQALPRERITMDKDKGTFRIPDLRGYFLRGADDTASINPDGKNQPVLATQKSATALPHNPFKTDEQGEHDHGGHTDVSKDTPTVLTWFGGDRGAPGGTDARGSQVGFPIHKDGRHSHTVVSGGDTETHPANVAVTWLIRF